MMNMNLKMFGDSLGGYTTGTYWTVIVNILQRAILKTNGTPEVLFGETRTDQDQEQMYLASIYYKGKFGYTLKSILQYLKP